MPRPCIYCGHPADQVDRIHPRSRGGTDEPSNLAPACKSCNSANGQRLLFSSVVLLAVLAALNGCAPGGASFQMTMMRRDGGHVYQGMAHGDGNGGHGSMAVNIDGTNYTGPMVRTAVGSLFGLGQQYGGPSYVGRIAIKAILSSPDGKGLRCDLSADGAGHAGGLCQDDMSRVYDVVLEQS